MGGPRSLLRGIITFYIFATGTDRFCDQRSIAMLMMRIGVECSFLSCDELV